MGFMDKAKKFAQDAQQQAKDGTLKDRAKAMAEQAQKKLDEVQTQFNEGQRSGGTQAPAVEYDQHGRPIAGEPVPDAPEPAETEAVPEAAVTPPPAEPTPAAPPAEPRPAPESVADVDRSANEAPKLTGGDPLAG
jgi:hypothetical protein